MKTYKELNEKIDRQYTADYTLSKSGRKVHRTPLVDKDAEKVDEEKNIEVTMKSGHKFTAPIKVSGQDWHIVKHPTSGKQYRVDHKGNTLEEDLSEEALDEISQKLAGDYYGAATKKHIEKVGVKPDMYGRIEKDMGKNRKAGVDRALDRVMGNRKTNEETILEGAYEKSEENKRSADAAKKQGDMFAHHLHMSDYHDNLAQWHSEKGRHSVADDHAKKSEEHHEKAMGLKEQAPVAPSIGVHRIAVTTSEPDHPAVSKRDETTQRFVRVTAHDKDKAVEQGMKHFKKKGFKVHGAEHVGMVHESYHDNRRGFGRREREDDEYHVPDPTVKNKVKKVQEVLSPEMGAGEYIKDFQKSDAPQFKGKSQEKRRMMGIAAYMAAKKDMKEEAEQIDEKSEQAKRNKTMKNMMDASRGARYKVQNKVSADDVRDWDGKHPTPRAQNVAIGRALRNEDLDEAKKDDVPFDGPYTKTPGNVKDKSGAVHTPMSRARDLARQAMKKQMKEEEDLDLTDEQADELMIEALTGQQHKIDKNKNGKVDSHDFKILRGEVCPECGKSPCECGTVKESGEVETRSLSFGQFMSQLNEYTPGPGGVTRVQGRSYGAQYRDPEGEDDADDKKKQVAKSEPAVKRGRGRPAGSKSGANQKVTTGRKGSGVDYTGYKLHLPNSNR